MNIQIKTDNKEVSPLEQQWPWWPLLPLYPYGRKRTFFKELSRNFLWSFEQLQGLYYVAVPVRLTVAKVPGGLMLFNPLPPTKELLNGINLLQKKHGPVLTIVLPTASGLEHKISLPALARAFPKASLWLCPGQWSFPLGLPLDWLGIPRSRTKFLIEDGFPHEDVCNWLSLGPIDIGLGRFQEIACFHKSSRALLCTDALVGIQSDPPELFREDPIPLLFHARDFGDQPLKDSLEQRKKGWKRLVLFASFLRPKDLSIPPLSKVFSNSLKPGLRNSRSHFGVFPFSWNEGWESSSKEIIGERSPLLQVPPVVKRLIFPRAKGAFIKWLDDLSSLKGIRWLVSAHFSAPVEFSAGQIRKLRRKTFSSSWERDDGNWEFLNKVDSTLLKKGVVPKDPLKQFTD